MDIVINRILFAQSTPKSLNSNHRIGYCTYEALKFLHPDVSFSAFPDITLNILSYKPDTLVMFGSFAHNAITYDEVVEVFRQSNGKQIIWWTHDDPYELDIFPKIREYGDIFITNDRTALMFYQTNHPVFHIPIAACYKCFYHSVNTRNGKLAFIGNNHKERELIFKKIKDDSLDIFGTNWPEKTLPSINNYVNSDFSRSIYATYSGTLDIQRKTSLYNSYNQVNSSTPGPRIFEMALSGANIFSLTDSLEVLNYFPDDMISVGNSVDEYIDFKLRSISDMNWSIIKGLTTQKYAIAKHTHANRVRDLLKIFD